LDVPVEKKGNRACPQGDGRGVSLGGFYKIQEVQWDTRRGFIGEVLGLLDGRSLQAGGMVCGVLRA